MTDVMLILKKNTKFRCSHEPICLKTSGIAESCFHHCRLSWQPPCCLMSWHHLARAVRECGDNGAGTRRSCGIRRYWECVPDTRIRVAPESFDPDADRKSGDQSGVWVELVIKYEAFHSSQGNGIWRIQEFHFLLHHVWTMAFQTLGLQVKGSVPVDPGF